MTENKWNTEKIREAFIYDGGESEFHDPEHGAQTQRQVAGKIFDDWLVQLGPTPEDIQAEAFKRYHSDVSDELGPDGEPMAIDDWGYAAAERGAFIAGAEWAKSQRK